MMKLKLFLSGLCFLGLLMTSNVSFAEVPLPETPEQAPVPQSAKLASSSAESQDVLTSGDRLKIKIYPEDEYVKGGEMNISAEGNITLPLLGRVNVAGLTIIEAEKKLAELIDRDYLVDPEVAIELSREQAMTKNTIAVAVLGAVKKPGNFDIETKGKPVTLIQAILNAGGFSDIANIKKIKIVRKTAKSNKMIRANAESILSGEDPDVVIEGGDIVTVSESLF